MLQQQQQNSASGQDWHMHTQAAQPRHSQQRHLQQQVYHQNACSQATQQHSWAARALQAAPTAASSEVALNRFSEVALNSSSRMAATSPAAASDPGTSSRR
jgi:hypothetical protein